MCQYTSKTKNIKSEKTILKKMVILFMVLVLGGMHFTIGTEAVNVSAAKMNKTLSKAVRGKWWTQNSSGGYDVRFTSKKISYYEHGSNKPAKVRKIKNCKKVKSGYLIIIKDGEDVYSYLYEKDNPTVLTFLCAVNQKQIDEGVGYSNSSSLSEGKWDDNN